MKTLLVLSNSMPLSYKKVKIHLLHLTDSIIDFGPTSAFNTERYKSFSVQDILKGIKARVDQKKWGNIALRSYFLFNLIHHLNHV